MYFDLNDDVIIFKICFCEFIEISFVFIYCVSNRVVDITRHIIFVFCLNIGYYLKAKVLSAFQVAIKFR